MNRFDIIIAGGGLSGLTLALELTRHPFFQDKSIAILERSVKNQNDRTWCFWAQPDDEVVPPYVYRQWQRCRFYTRDISLDLDMGAYRYYMVRGIDFYRYADEQLGRLPNFRRIACTITGFHARGGLVHTDQGDFSAEWIFNSALSALPPTPTVEGLFSPSPHSHFSTEKKFTYLWQHFKGYVVRTNDPVFDPGSAILMDYRTEHEGDTRFFYVLPFHEREALVEYTIFSERLETPEHYDAALRRYLQERLGLEEYTLVDTEFGVIPMSDQRLSARQQGRLINIGTAGGFVKASSGYAFKNTRKRLIAFVRDWAQTGRPKPELMNSRYRRRAYDSVLLRVLRDKMLSGEQVFGTLFNNMPASKVFRFLDEDSTFPEELAIMNTMPKIPFLRAAVKQIPTFPRI